MRGLFSSLVVEDGVATFVLNNPAKRNALGSAMVKSLAENISNVRSDKSVRILLIKAEGHVFSSGHDLKELAAMDEADARMLFQSSAKMMKDLQELPVPVLAQVDGLAAAAGLQLLAGCDMAVCTKGSSFSTPGVRVGLFCTTPAVAAFRSSYSPKLLSHMLFTGDAIDASQALRIGLVSHVFDTVPEMESFVDGTCQRIKSLPRDVIKLGKLAFIRQTQMRNKDEAMNFGIDVMVDNLLTNACKSGLEAFAKKETPKWD